MRRRLAPLAAAELRRGGAPLPAPAPQRPRGHALEPRLAARMGARFGHDFSGVRIRTESGAAAAAGFAAVTRGREVAFAPGRYAPGTPAGARLLAHELTHVVQQARGGASAGPVASERDADRNADRVAAGGPARVATAAPAGRLQAAEKKGRSGEASFGQKTETKAGKEKTTTEAKLSGKVPLLPDGTFGPLTLLENAKLTLKAGETVAALEPDDPTFKTQLDIALSLARLKLLEPFYEGAGGTFTLPSDLELGLGTGVGVTGAEGKATLSPSLEADVLGYKLPKLSGDFGTLTGGMSLTGSAKGTVATGAGPTAEAGAKLGATLGYASPKLPYAPYGPSGPLQHGQLSLGLKGSLGAGYATDEGAKLSAGAGASAGYQWPSLYGVSPTVTVSFDLAWSRVGDKVSTSHVSAIALGAKF